MAEDNFFDYSATLVLELLQCTRIAAAARMSPDIAGMWLSAEVADVQALQLRLRRVLEEGGTILSLALLYPMPVYAESTSVDDLSENAHGIGVT